MSANVTSAWTAGSSSCSGNEATRAVIGAASMCAGFNSSDGFEIAAHRTPPLALGIVERAIPRASIGVVSHRRCRVAREREHLAA